MPLLIPSHPSLTHLRTFTCTARTMAKSTKQRLAHEHSSVPPYPYGPSQVYKQSNFGLYGLQKIRYGNMVSEKNEIKTRRHWRPNVHFKKLWSESLKHHIRIRVTTRVLRTIDKVGGLDSYLLGEKAMRLKELGMGGWKLRWRLLQSEAVKERFRRQRVELGLPPHEEVLVGSNGNLATREQVQREVDEIDRELEEGGVELSGGEESVAEDGEFMQEKSRREEKSILI